jgi:Cache domain
MPLEERFEFRVSFQKLLVGLLLTLVPISLVGLYSVSLSHKSLERAVGNHFKALAEITAAATSQFINDLVVGVASVAAEPSIVDAVVASNRSYQGMTDAAIFAKFEKLDRAWNTPAADTLVKEMLSTRASRLLRRHQELDRRILRITVTDAKGATVAASHKTLDYYQADEEYWQNIYAQGRGAVSLTDILYDEATKSYYIGVGVPVLDGSSTQFIGTLDALVDVSTLFPIVNRVQLGPTGLTMLVKDDGTVISAPQMNLAMKQKADEYLAVQEALNTLQGRETGYLVADIRGRGQNLIGFADTGLKQDYRNLGWVVLVVQNVSEALAPARTTERLIAFISLLSLVMVTLLGAYFSMHSTQQFTRIGEVNSKVSPEGAVEAAVQPEQGGRAAADKV